MASLNQRQRIRRAAERLQLPAQRRQNAVYELLNYAGGNERTEQPNASEVLWSLLEAMDAVQQDCSVFCAALRERIEEAYPAPA